MIKVTPADKWFSLCVRERADWTCERCGKSYHHDPGRLQCSHVYSRRWASIRHHPLNAMALDYACHRHVGENPIDHVELYLKVFGQDAYDEIRRLKEVIVRKRDRPDREVARHLKSEYDRLKEARLAGESGRVEFEGYPCWTLNTSA